MSAQSSNRLFFQNGCHILLYRIVEEKDNKKDTSKKVLPHCHLLADNRKLLPGAANIYSLPICKRCDFGPRAFFFFFFGLNRASTVRI